MSSLKFIEMDPVRDADATVIWLHGLGANGHDFVPVVKELQLPESLPVRFIFPHAPTIPVTVNGGYVMPAWYDIYEMTLDRRVDTAQLEASAAAVQQLIEREIARGIAPRRIVLAGFSQGGAVVYQAALASDQPLGGLLVLSSYFATAQTIQANPASRSLPILIQHGTRDAVVPEQLGLAAKNLLTDRGYSVEYQQYPMEHTVCGPQIRAISEWLQRVLARA